MSIDDSELTTDSMLGVTTDTAPVAVAVSMTGPSPGIYPVHGCHPQALRHRVRVKPRLH